MTYLRIYYFSFFVLCCFFLVFCRPLLRLTCPHVVPSLLEYLAIAPLSLRAAPIGFRRIRRLAACLPVSYRVPFISPTTYALTRSHLPPSPSLTTSGRLPTCRVWNVMLLPVCPLPASRFFASLPLLARFGTPAAPVLAFRRPSSMDRPLVPPKFLHVPPSGTARGPSGTPIHSAPRPRPSLPRAPRRLHGLCGPPPACGFNPSGVALPPPTSHPYG